MTTNEVVWRWFAAASTGPDFRDNRPQRAGTEAKQSLETEYFHTAFYKMAIYFRETGLWITLKEKASVNFILFMSRYKGKIRWFVVEREKCEFRRRTVVVFFC